MEDWAVGLIITVGIILFIVVISGIKVVPQAKAYVVERLGAYRETKQTGLHFIIPVFERVAKVVSLKEQVVDFAPQPVITKDNVTMQIDTVVFYQITDAKLYAYGVESPIMAIENLTATTLRNIIGELELDNTLTSRDTINAKIRSILDEATDPWGIKINRVELKNIKPPAEIQDAMEKQMKAERQRREAILRAEGEKASNILVAEGKKASQILTAEAEKQAAILKAEAEKEAAILKAEADSVSHYQFVHFAEIDRDYLAILEDVQKEWTRIEKEYGVPYFPHVSCGWDNNPRFKHFRAGIVKNNSPENIQKAMQMAKEYLDRHQNIPPLVTVNSWNEWTETSYLQPDNVYGYGYLEAVKKVFKD